MCMILKWVKDFSGNLQFATKQKILLIQLKKSMKCIVLAIDWRKEYVLSGAEIVIINTSKKIKLTKVNRILGYVTTGTM